MTLIADRPETATDAPQNEAVTPEDEAPRRRRGLVVPGKLGNFALVLALLGMLLAVLVFYGYLDWIVPIFAIAPAAALAIAALMQHEQRRMAAVAALVISAFSLMPSTASLALAGYASALDGDRGLLGTSEVSTYDALRQVVTGEDATDGTDGTDGTGGTNGGTGANGSTGAAGANGSSGANGTNGTSGTNGTNGSNGTTVDVGTGGPLIDVNIGGGTPTAPTAPVAPVIAVDTSGVVGDLLTTSANVKVTVGSVTCGLPVISILGISLGLGGQLCSVGVSVTNSGSSAVTINNGSLTGVSGGTSILGDVNLGTSPLSTSVAAGATVTGKLFVKLPSSSSVLDRIELRVGGELLKVQVG